MTGIDAIIAVCLIYNGFMGLKRGFVRLVLDIASLLISTLFALLYFDKVRDAILHYTPSLSKYAAVIGFGMIWIGLFFSISVLAMFLDKVLSRTLILGPIDRLLGLGIGLLKGVLFLLPILIPLYALDLPALQHSVFSKPLTPLLGKLSHSFRFNVLTEKPLTPEPK